jgi:hypothetical protein
MNRMTRFSPASKPILAALLLALSLVGRAQVSHAVGPVGPAKVRILVTENTGDTTAGKPGATPEPGAPAAAPVAGKTPPKAYGTGKGAAAVAASEAMYTHSVTKSLSIRVSNLTTQPLDITLKTTFLAKDEGNKHEVVTEKAVENKVTIVPGQSQELKTEDVTYTHTAAHRPRSATGGSLRGRAPIIPMQPASGHTYSGYKVEAYAGAEMVGSANSAGY